MIRYECDDAISPVATWAAVGEHPEVTGRWPLDSGSLALTIARTHEPARIDDYDDVPGRIAMFVRDTLEVRSSVGSPILVEGRLWGALFVHTTHAEPLAPDTESRIAAFTDLVATAISNIETRSELAASRARIVAATDQERRRLVRDLHDGAQQRLVHTVITLKLARQALLEGKASAPTLVDQALDHADQATAEVRELAHGILPAVLTHGGLRAGVDALAARMPVPVETDVSVDRLPPSVEATAYFVVAEALTNVAKHAQARRAAVIARVEGGTLRLRVSDDGVGGARSDGSGLVGLADRLAVLDGRLRVESPAGGGTLVSAGIPLRD
jgi:signal transduction histidine kinase